MTGDDTERGQPFDGRYRVLGRLGVGGMATVYLAEDTSLGRKVAIKVLAERYAEDGSSSSASAARRSPPRASTTRTSSRSTTAAWPTAVPTSRWSTWRARTLKHVIQKDGAAAGRARDRVRDADARGPALRARPRRRAPRRQAAQRARRRRRPDQGHRLRHRARRRSADDRGRLDRRHGAVPLARAGARRGRARRPTSTRSASCSTRCSPGRVPFEGDSSVAIAMKHVSEEPPPLRSHAPLVPESLAMVVAHAMLKERATATQRRRVRRRPRPRAARARARRRAPAMMAAVVPHEPTEFVPPPRRRASRRGRRATPLLSGEKPPPGPTRRKRSRWPWLLVLLLVLAVGALAAFALGGGLGRRLADDDDARRARGRRSRPPVTSRKLEDLDGQVATRRPRRRSRATGCTSSQEPARARQRRTRPASSSRSDPAAGQVLHDGDTVLLKVSRGPEADPEHRRHDDGATAQQALGSDFKSSERVRGQRHRAKGKITRTEPRSARRTPVGSTVTYWSRPGPEAVQVPDLVGKTEADARAALDAGRPDRQGAAGRPLLGRRRGRPGREAGHRRRARAVQKGKAISFDLANSPCTIDVPSVRGRSLDEAPGHPRRPQGQVPASSTTRPSPTLDRTASCSTRTSRARTRSRSSSRSTVGQLEPERSRRTRRTTP